MATYYVDLSASTNGSGTQNSPYSSFSPFSASITPGDNIRVKRGTTRVLNSDTRLNVTITGSSPGVVTLIDTYGDGAPPVLDSAGTFNPIYVKRHEGGGQLIIRDLDVTGGANHGCAVESQSGVTIDNVLLQRIRAYGNNTLSGAGKDGISIGCAKDGGLITRVVVDSCDAYNNNGHGIKVRDNTSGIIVKNCRAWGNGLTTPAHGMGTAHTRAVVSSAGAWVATSGGAYQATISTTSLLKTTITQWFAVYCSSQNGYFWLTPSASSPPPLGSFYTGGSNTLEINVGAAPTAASVAASYLPVDGRFESCDVWGTNDFDGNEGHGFGTDDQTTYAEYQGCRSHDNEGCGWTANVTQGVLLTGCIAVGNAKQGLLASGGKLTYAYNSTFLRNGQQGWRATSGATGGVLRNCIFAENTGYGISSTTTAYTIDDDYNCVYGNVAGARENVSTTGSHGITANPLLQSSLVPYPNSPCIRTGINDAVVVLRDFYGKHIDGSPDIGAKQYRASRNTSSSRTLATGRIRVSRTGDFRG